MPWLLALAVVACVAVALACVLALGLVLERTARAELEAELAGKDAEIARLRQQVTRLTRAEESAKSLALLVHSFCSCHDVAEPKTPKE